MYTDEMIKDILREAIQSEREAFELYTRAVDLVQAEHIKEMLHELARQELGHEASLENWLANPGALRLGVRVLREAPIQDYKIGDHLVPATLGPDSTFQDVCIYASKKEQRSYELYEGLAEKNTGEVRDLLKAMARDELRHKNLVERWYEEIVYQDF
jgi:rubrerythrin